MPGLSSVCVYCGSRVGSEPRYRDTAARTGRLLAERGIRLVYGGGRVGLMGVMADAALAGGGRVTGVIPGYLQAREVGHEGLSELLVVEDMHQRKQKMFDISDAFLALPGGIGTLDEAFEMVTWRQLALHSKPVVFVDDGGYWRPLLAFIEHVIAHVVSEIFPQRREKLPIPGP